MQGVLLISATIAIMRAMFTAFVLVGFLIVAAAQTQVTVVRITLLLLAVLIGVGAGASSHRRP